MKLITGNIPKVVEHSVLEAISFYDRAEVSDIRKFVEKRDNIPVEARFRTTVNPEWGVTECQWTWFEVEL